MKKIKEFLKEIYLLLKEIYFECGLFGMIILLIGALPLIIVIILNYIGKEYL
jgi:hypothetical protein